MVLDTFIFSKMSLKRPRTALNLRSILIHVSYIERKAIVAYLKIRARLGLNRKARIGTWYHLLNLGL